MAAGTTQRLLEVARPYRGRFLLGLIATLLASLLDGVTIVVLVPLLTAIFGTAGAPAGHGPPAAQGTLLERLSDQLLGPLVSGIAPRAAAFRLVLALLAGLLLKNALQYS